ncbi:hypothetical protein GIY62_26220 [Burkholderia plantarii]|nr:hypothetical protein GIY62_26220 [Burkholderia plantarii]
MRAASRARSRSGAAGSAPCRPVIRAPLDLAKHPCVCCTGRHAPYRRQFARSGDAPLGVTVSGPLASDDAELPVEAAVDGLGMLYTSDWYAGRDLAAGRLVEILPDWPRLDRGSVYVVMPAAGGTSSRTRAFSDRIAAQLAVPPWAAR